MRIGDRRQDRILDDHRLGDHQLAHQIDEAVKFQGIDPDDTGRGGRGGLGRRPGHGGGCRNCRRGPNCNAAEVWVGWRRLVDQRTWGGRISPRRLNFRRWGGRRARRRWQRSTGKEGVGLGDQTGNGQADRPPRQVASKLLRQLSDIPLEDIGAFEDQADRRSAQHEPALAGGIEERLHLVGELLKRGQLDDADIAFEGVEGTEQRVKRWLVGGVAFEDENPLLDLVEKVVGLRAEELQHLRIALLREHRHLLVVLAFVAGDPHGGGHRGRRLGSLGRGLRGEDFHLERGGWLVRRRRRNHRG